MIRPVELKFSVYNSDIKNIFFVILNQSFGKYPTYRNSNRYNNFIN